MLEKEQEKPITILLVGAGGTGSEFVHALLLSSFAGHLLIVDFDLVEVSNLSRQRYFSESDLSEHKAKIVSEKVERISKGRISSRFYTENIESASFDSEFFKQFLCVVSCVDTIEAREHINKMCFLACTPMIDSGSAGYLGQVQTFIPGKTECYSCTGPAEQVNYPICTIRGIPDSWHHCVHWAAYDLLPKIENKSLSVASKHGLDSILSNYSRKIDKDRMCRSILSYIKENSQTRPSSTPVPFSNIQKIHELASIYADAHSILIDSISETEKIVRKTIPSILTTNTIIGSLIYLSMHYLHLQCAPREYYLLFSSEIRKVPSPEKSKECSVCSCTPLAYTPSFTDTFSSFFSRISLPSDILSVTNSKGHLIYDKEFQDSIDTPLYKIAQSGSFIKVYTESKTYLIYLKYLNTTQHDPI